jgi:hypothetical protein
MTPRAPRPGSDTNPPARGSDPTSARAVLMIAIAACCACRLVLSRLRGRDTELDTDGLHILMGAAMAGMLEPRLTPIPATAWRAVFAAAATWFALQAIRAGGQGGSARSAHLIIDGLARARIAADGSDSAPSPGGEDTAARTEAG